jgi:hypothetical protein
MGVVRMGRDVGETAWQASRGVGRRLARGIGLAQQRCVRLIPMVYQQQWSLSLCCSHDTFTPMTSRL